MTAQCDIKEKYPFVVDGAFLCDPPGARIFGAIHISMFGESFTDEERAAHLRDVASDDRRRQCSGIRALGPERSPEYLDALLHAINTRNPMAASASVRFSRDTRVREALLRAARSVPLADVDAFASALGSVGGPDALSVLECRFHEARAGFREFSTRPHFDHVASQLGTLSQAILRLDPDATMAAQMLVDLFGHPLAMNRESAFRQALEIYRWRSRTEAMWMLAAGFESVLKSDDVRTFLIVGPALVRDHFEIVHPRYKSIIFEGDPTFRHDVIFALAMTPYPFTGSALATLASWICLHVDDLEIAPSDAALVHDFLPPSTTLAVLRRALAAQWPSRRFDAIQYIERLAPELASPLMDDALDDEPDPFLRKRLHVRTQSS